MAKKFVVGANVTANLARIEQSADQLAAKESFSIQYLNLAAIVRSEKNFYRIEDIDALAEDILLHGLQHNLVVRPTEAGTYELISGERRFTALSRLAAEGNAQFQLVPCKIEDVDDLIAEERLIAANALTRVLMPAEQLEQVARLKEIYRQRQARGETLPGRLRERIAEKLQISPAQVGKLERLAEQLTETERAAFSSGELNVKTATETVKAKQPAKQRSAKDKTELSAQRAGEAEVAAIYDDVVESDAAPVAGEGMHSSIPEPTTNTQMSDDVKVITRALQEQIIKGIADISNAVKSFKDLPHAHSSGAAYLETVAGALREIIADLET